MSDFIENFRRTIEASYERLSLIAESESQKRTTEGKWSPKEIIGHLIDSAANNHQRFIRAQFKDDLIFQGYEQNEWVKAQHYNQESWQLLLQLWRAYNLHLAHVISNIPEASMKRICRKHNLHEIGWKSISEEEGASLEYLIRDYIGHLEHHLNQALNER